MRTIQKFKILPKKEVKKILSLIEKQFGCRPELDYCFIRTLKENLYISNKDIGNIDFTKINVNSIGMYFCELKGDSLRLSIEGSQIIGPFAKKNVLELDDKHALQWMNGIDISTADINTTGLEKNYILLKHKNDFLGSGKLAETKILNFVPKVRRMHLSV